MKILFLTARPPDPIFKADQHRTYHQIRELVNRHSVTVLTLAQGEQAIRRCEEALHPLGVRVEAVIQPKHPNLRALVGLCTRVPLQVYVNRSRRMRQRLEELLNEQEFDWVHATTMRMVEYGLQVGDRARKLMDCIDCLSLAMHRRQSASSLPISMVYWLEGRRLRELERRTLPLFDRTAVISERDREAMGSPPNMEIVPNGVDTDRWRRLDVRKDPERLVFSGYIGALPNADAALYLCTEIMPRIWARRPSVKLDIVGADPPDKLRHRASNGKITVTGFVTDMVSCLNAASVAVAPLRCSTGLQNKVLEAFACGLPVVATPLANAGIGARPGHEILEADDPDTFADHVLRLLADEHLRARLARAGQTLVAEQWSWSRHVGKLEACYARPGAAAGAAIRQAESA